MLHILLMLLKIIGIILLIILGILVLSVCVVLFAPAKYHGTANASGTLDSIKANIKFSWFLHLISGYVTYENKKTDWQVRILWKKLNVEKEEQMSEPKNIEKTKKITEEDNKSDKETLHQPETDIPQVKPGKEMHNKKKQGFFEKIKYTFQNICDKIKMLIKKKEDLQGFLTSEIHQSAWKCIKREAIRLLKYIRPKKMTANLHFGFEDPATTGKVLAALSILYPFYGDHINIEPEFEEKILEGNVFIKGYIMCIHLLIVIFNLYFDKNLKTTYKDIQKWKK